MKRSISRLIVALAAMALATLVPATANESPTTVYEAYVKAMSQAKDLADIYPYLSQDKIAGLRAMDAQQRAASLGLLKAFAPREVRILKHSVQGDKAVLHVQGLSQSLAGNQPEKSYGKVEMVREGGKWKLFHEGWSNSKPTD